MKRATILVLVVAATMFGVARAAQAAALVGKAAPEVSAQDWLNSPPLAQVTLLKIFFRLFRPAMPHGAPEARGGRRKVDVVTTYPID